ncbi:MAG: flagellar hook-basal body complex protein FliE [Methylophilales bacterium RIFCSPHIGHO2_02_FULL_57_10]|nr:MAG: flagellar hook-basal body complex protein FliE [Methylophilales bacterium RIFCSPHIGHO2_02_FULL_57_10]
MDTKGIDQLLTQLNAAAAMAGGKASPPPAEGVANFADALKGAIDQVHAAQQGADKQAQDFQLGKPDANLQDVMISLQKASISFQTMVQVRNKLVAAYQDVMNMQV